MEAEEREKWEGLGTPMTSGGHKVDVEGAAPDYKYGRNKPESEFLTSLAEYSWSCERTSRVLPGGRALNDEVIHMIGVPGPSPFFALFR